MKQENESTKALWRLRESVKRKYYIYVVFRPNGVPCYVGKGSGTRWTHHDDAPKNKHLRYIRNLFGAPLPRVKVCQDLTETEAFEYEIAWIAALKRERDGGVLVNVMLGGEGSSVNKMGHSVSSETRDKIRKAHSGSKRTSEQRAAQSAAMKGIPKSEAHIEAVRAALLAAHANNPELGRKNSQRNLGVKRSPESRARMSAARQAYYEGHEPAWRVAGYTNSSSYFRHVRQGKIAPPEMPVRPTKKRTRRITQGKLQAPGVGGLTAARRGCITCLLNGVKRMKQYLFVAKTTCGACIYVIAADIQQAKASAIDTINWSGRTFASIRAD